MDKLRPGRYNMRMYRNGSRLLALCAALLGAAACSPAPTKPRATEEPQDHEPVTAATAAELTAAVEQIFTTSCALSGCHSGAAPESGLSLEAARYLSDTVDQPARQLESMMRVLRGEPDQSYLVHKIRGTQDDAGGRGNRMPPKGPPLPLESIETIEAWVASLILAVDADGDGRGSDVDCDDSDASIYPGAEDITGNTVDEDCSGSPLDADGDGYNAPADGGADTDDSDATVHPEAPELCFDATDNDQDGSTDEGCVADADGDGHDSLAAGGDDADDDDPTVYPGAPEICGDGKDNDQNGQTDAPLCDPNTDDDGDGEAEVAGDCNDNNAAISTTAPEIGGNAIDENCDGIAEDRDGDTVTATTLGGADCNDLDAAIRPGATDRADNGLDEDCDGLDATLMTFTRIQNEIFAEGVGAGCAASDCHDAADPAEGLNLTPLSAYSQTVGVNSVQLPSMKRIKAGDPANSYLLRKLKGTHSSAGGEGVRMPKGGGALSSDEITKVQNWIAHGAQNN